MRPASEARDSSQCYHWRSGPTRAPNPRAWPARPQGIGSIIAGLISWRIAISNHRQAWINALRDDLATYLKELEVGHYEIGKLFSAKTDDGTLEKQKSD